MTITAALRGAAYAVVDLPFDLRYRVQRRRQRIEDFSAIGRVMGQHGHRERLSGLTRVEARAFNEGYATGRRQRNERLAGQMDALRKSIDEGFAHVGEQLAEVEKVFDRADQRDERRGQ